MIAQFSYEASPQGKAERGVKPTASAIRNAVREANYSWPWKNDSDVQAVRRARKDYLAGTFDGVVVEGGTRGKHSFRVGAAGHARNSRTSSGSWTTGSKTSSAQSSSLV